MATTTLAPIHIGSALLTMALIITNCSRLHTSVSIITIVVPEMNTVSITTIMPSSVITIASTIIYFVSFQMVVAI
jgi:hypothetical protein